jgi:hypothetical protein
LGFAMVTRGLLLLYARLVCNDDTRECATFLLLLHVQ